MLLTKFRKLNLYKWIEGRQGSGYEKMLLLTGTWPCCFDVYFLRFKECSYIPEHTDPCKDGYKHYRFNLILKKSISGGLFVAEKHIWNFSRLKFFRPDLYKHSVTEVRGGNRYVLSLGFLIKE